MALNTNHTTDIITPTTGIFSVAGAIATGVTVVVPPGGSTIVIANGISALVMNPAATLATTTLTMPSAPINGQIVRISINAFNITALTIQGAGTQTMSGAPTSITPTTPVCFIWVPSIGTAGVWVRV